MRDVIVGRKMRRGSMVHARRIEKRMGRVRAHPGIPVGMDAREVAKELKREGSYAWASNHDGIVLRI